MSIFPSPFTSPMPRPWVNLATPTFSVTGEILDEAEEVVRVAVDTEILGFVKRVPLGEVRPLEPERAIHDVVLPVVVDVAVARAFRVELRLQDALLPADEVFGKRAGAK